MKRFACLILVLAVLFSAYELHSIASTDSHNAYCSQISNAVTNYMANPFLTKAEFKEAEKPLLAVLKRGNKYPQVYNPVVMAAVAKTIGNVTSPDNQGKIVDWSNYVKQETASYLVADNC